MPTILILEDEVNLKELFGIVLRQNEYTVLEATTAAEAEQLSSDQRIDVLIANVVLPGGRSGPDFAVALVQSQPHVKTLFISGWLVHRSPDAANIAKMPEGSYRVLHKPFGTDALIHEVRRVLGDVRRLTA